jgi:amino acid adenylation domain
MSTSVKSKLTLSPQKRAVLASLLKEEGLPVPSAQGIPRRREGEPVRLSFSQERVWFLEQLQPGSPVHNIPSAFRLPGPLNVTALELSLNEMVRRHEVLRTTFHSSDGQPVQVIAPVLKVNLQRIDLTHMPAQARELETYRLATEEALRPFDLEQGPLLRTTLLRLAPMDHTLLLSLHHIIADGWSITIVWRELAALYEHYNSGRALVLPELPIQYADFAQWQRDYLRGEVLEKHLAFWRKQLTGAPTVLALPTDRPRPIIQRYAGAVEWWSVSDQVAQGLKTLSEQEGATLFMTLLAAFKVLLHRYTGRADLVVGTPIANRARTELEGLIGFFVNMLVLRSDFSGNPGFRAALGRVREVTLAAYAHQDLPFEKLVEEQQPERDLGHNPLFQVMFVFQNVPAMSQAAATPQPSSGSQAAAPAGNATAKFDLTLFALETERGLAGAVEYNTDLFEASTIQRLVGHFQNLLAAIVADPDRPLSELGLLSEAERRQILFDWNATGAEYPRDVCLHDLFVTHAAKTPHAVAIAGDSRQLTYAELDQRSTYLATLLVAAGVGPEVPVGVLTNRSIEGVVAALAILKAGGFYVPLEATHPKERLAAILADCKARVLVTEGQLAQELQVQLLKLDEIEWALAEEQPTLSAIDVAAENLACVLYTSGPGGKPTGVSLSHRAIVRTVFDEAIVNLGPEDRVAHLSEQSASAATFEIWGALLHGAQLALIAADPYLSPRLFAAEIASSRISVLFLKTAVFNYLVAEVPHAFRSIRDLYISGESADPTKVKQCLQQAPPIRLINTYGLSECSPLIACEIVTGVIDGVTTIPIGRPVSNTRIHVLDKSFRPVPVGVVGELSAGGDGVGRDYFNEPALTAACFTPDPFGEPGARLCMTGDLGRYLPDGRIEFVGRKDRRTKIKGFRVDPQEVEEALAQHPKVSEAAVLVRQDLAGDKQLTAYLVAGKENEPTPSELRRFLRSKLPDYMLPAEFILISALPRTAAGQLDIAALPLPDTERPPLEQTFVAPRTAVEKELGRIWSQVFGLAKVGIRDNFFHLGGHSLLATQVISRARDAFQIELAVRRLFESPTVEGLAKYIETAREGQVKVELRVTRSETEEILERLEELSEAEVDSLLAEMLQESAPAVAVIAEGAVDKIKPRAEDELLNKLDQLAADEVDSLLDQLLAEETSK